MPRRGTVERRRPTPDARYGSLSVQMFINKLMMRGKKSTAEKIVYDAMELVEDRMKRPALDVFDAALRNVTPVLEVKPRRVGGFTCVSRRSGLRCTNRAGHGWRLSRERSSLF